MRNLCSIASALAAAALSLTSLSPARAAPIRADASGGTQLIMLGTGGGPLLRKDRAEPATLLIVDGTPYLIDCGIGVLRRMVEARMDPASVRTIFITHHHPDHDLELVGLMGNASFGVRYNSDQKASFDIYGPPGTTEMVDAGIQYLGVPFDTFSEEGLGGRIDKSSFSAHDIEQSGPVYQDKNIKVTAMENSHYALMSASSRAHRKSYAYRIETPHAVIVFTGDTGPSDALEKFAKGADVLVSEVINQNAIRQQLDRVAAANHWPEAQKAMGIAHMEQEHSGPEVVAHLASAAGVKSVLLNHVVPGMDNDDEEVKADAAGVRAGYTGQIIAARDLDRYCINVGGDKGTVLTACK